MFKLAYGRDQMSDETRQTLLHSQMQKGLQYDVMKALMLYVCTCSASGGMSAYSAHTHMIKKA